MCLFAILLVFSYITARVDNIVMGDALYFIFITALTVGYGDITPASGITQIVGVLTGVVGIIFGGLVVAISVRALELAGEEKRRLQSKTERSGEED